jgi:hypothetical protein
MQIACPTAQFRSDIQHKSDEKRWPKRHRIYADVVGHDDRIKGWRLGFVDQRMIYVVLFDICLSWC